MKNSVTTTVKNYLPISKKAYSDFSGRLRSTFEAIGFERLCEEAVNLLDAYLRGDDSCITTVDAMVKIAFSMIKPEIDKAMARSAAARERARNRRKKANATTEQPATEHPVIEQPAEEEPQSEKATMNRRERRELAQEMARVQRRHARRMMRLKKEREKSDRLCLSVGC